MVALNILLLAIIVATVRAADGPDEYPQSVTFSGNVPFNEFGSCMAYYGNNLIIGTKTLNDKFTQPNPGKGVVNIYQQKADGDWDTNPINTFYDPISCIPAANSKCDTYFGAAVAISANFFVVGAYKSQAAYIYYRNAQSGAWDTGLQTRVTGVAGDRFGVSVAVNSDTVAVGASTSNGNDGSVLLYSYPDTSPNAIPNRFGTVATLIIKGNVPKVNFGFALAMTENYLAISAPGNPEDGNGFGNVFLYGRSGGPGTKFSSTVLLTLTGNVPDGQFGFSLSLTDNEILVGDFNANGQKGVVTMVSFQANTQPNGSPLLQVTNTLEIYGTTPSTAFGWSVSIGVNTFGVGGNDNTAWIYSKQNGAWSSDVKALQTGPGGGFGYAVLNTDDWILVGAPLNLGTSTTSQNTGSAIMYRVYESSPINSAVIAALVCAGVTVLSVILLALRFYCGPKGDPPIMDAKAAAKAARLGWKHHNVAHLDLRRKGEAKKEKVFLAPQDHNPLRQSGMHRQTPLAVKQAAPVRPTGIKTFVPPGKNIPTTVVMSNNPMEEL